MPVAVHSILSFRQLRAAGGSCSLDVATCRVCPGESEKSL